ncbi:peroxidasin-like [Haliotis rufescens]|uniref:peroxidasin-like n=1 Tax=Haliotis rufescens TaxID=6454 RepID=UPI00201F9D33|nr:peroxidasin-like [Haliotis rufescens]
MMMMYLVALLCAGLPFLVAGGRRNINMAVSGLSGGVRTFNKGTKLGVIIARERARLSERITDDCAAKLKYRPIDGVCNNVDNPIWGAPLQAMRRFLPAMYDDNNGSPRLYGGGKNPLPSARKVSTECFPFDSMDTEDRPFSQMVMQWGQFLDHDISGTPMTGETGCCHGLAANGVHPDSSSEGPCFPIPIPPGDRHFRNCMEFSRSIPVDESSEDCHREQMNSLTAYLDSSHVYGGSDEETAMLRTHTGGLMRTTGNGDFLPHTNQTTCVKRNGHSCYDAGDVRVNVFPGLTAMHTLWVKEHNRIATKLAKFNSWDDEKLFQVARKIVIGSMQHITYNNWLKKVLGDNVYQLFDLAKTYQYNASLNPGVFNSFATAAFRFGHSQIAGHYRVKKNPMLDIAKMYMDTSYVTESFENVMYGIIDGVSQKVDEAFSTGVTDHLFENTSNPGVSLDLVALNIQRGRDHGLPPYMDFVYQWSKVPGMKNLLAEDVNVPKCAVGLYESLSQVDLFLGGMNEKHLTGAMVGPTFAYIIATQFHNLRYGDRFWYEGLDPDHGFTQAQIDEISKVTLAKVICQNSKINKIQPDVFKLTGAGNMKVKCRTLPSIKLRKWKD